LLKRIVSGIMLILLLISISTFALNIHPIKATPTTIVVPDDYPTIQEGINNANEGDTVFLRAGTYYEHVVVNRTLNIIGEDRNNVIIDGMGEYAIVVEINSSNVLLKSVTIQNTENKPPLLLSNVSGCIIDSITSRFSYTGMTVRYSHNCTIQNSIFQDNQGGICLYYSESMNFFNNTIERTEGKAIELNIHPPVGDSIKHLLHKVDPSNKVDGKPIYFWINEHHKEVPNDAGFVVLVNSTDIIVRNLNLSQNGLVLFYTENVLIDRIFAYSWHCVQLESCRNITVSEGLFTKNPQMLYSHTSAIYAWNSFDCTFYGNRFVQSYYSLWSEYCRNFTIFNNTFEKAYRGIDVGYGCENFRVMNNSITSIYERAFAVYESQNCTVEQNTFESCSEAILVSGSNFINIEGNKINNSTSYGICLSWSHDCKLVENNIWNTCGAWTLAAFWLQNSWSNNIYKNNFIHNTNQTHIDNTYGMVIGNVWDNDYEGNYWSNYNGTDSDGNGIGDTPYVIDEYNRDNYPLMNRRWNPADVNHDLKVDIYDVVLICAAYGSTPSDPKWNPHCDIAEPHQKIDIYDVVTACINYGKSARATKCQ